MRDAGSVARCIQPGATTQEPRARRGSTFVALTRREPHVFKCLEVSGASGRRNRGRGGYGACRPAVRVVTQSSVGEGRWGRGGGMREGLLERSQATTERAWGWGSRARLSGRSWRWGSIEVNCFHSILPTGAAVKGANLHYLALWVASMPPRRRRGGRRAGRAL